MKYPHLFKPIKIGQLNLANRIFMAPLTRCRAGVEHIPNELMATYYSQRVSAGLLIAEATMIQEGNSAFIAEPGIYSNEQAKGWRLVTDAVHNQGGRIFLQLWHGGRACHPDLNKGQRTVAPSPIAIDGTINTLEGKRVHTIPRQIEDQEIPTYVGFFKRAAVNAKEAGFDGVEIHAANGYLIDQFLRDGSNKRSGAYGGNLSKRARFLFEVVSAVIEVWGKDQVGVRISPLNSYNSMRDSDPAALTALVAEELGRIGIAYLHVIRLDFLGQQKGNPLQWARQKFAGILIGNGGFTPKEANDLIAKDDIQAVAFGHHFISNPNLVGRIRDDMNLVEPDSSTYYTPGAKGYTDYL